MKTWKKKLAPNRRFKKQVAHHAALVADFIYQIGEYKDLRKRSIDVPLNKINTKEYQAKFRYLKKCLIKYRKLTRVGRGITAVQVGIPEKFSVIYTPEKYQIIINPKITKVSKKKYLYKEMCMSTHPIVAPTVRPSWIEFEYFDEKGNKNYWNTKDNTKLGKILNRVFQHEIDHMDGIINIDRVLNSRDLTLHSDPRYYKTTKFILVS
ncbi:peptide deformylase [Candidatus Daviesbacteria bacterium]|nr:peptide deformylase [Candidatus Daviesbacteria bacterium]